MKQKNFLTNSIGVVLILFITSCSKDPTTKPSGSNQDDPQKIVNLVADNWVQQPSTWVYIDPILGIIQNWRQAKVYLEGSDGEILLGSTPTRFLTGEIWVMTSSADIILNYRDFTGSPLPFTSLNVKVVLTN